MRTGLLFLFLVPLLAHSQVTNTNQVAGVQLTNATNYSRLNLRDRSSWSSSVQAQRVNNAAAWQKLWNKMWGWRFSPSTATNSVQQGNNQQQAAPTNALPVVQPPVQTPQPQNGQPAPQVGTPNSNLQSALNIDNLNNTVWKNSGWQIVNPYESVLRDYRAAARAQRDFAMNPMSQMGGMGGYGSQMSGGYGNQMGGMGAGGMGQMGNYSSQFNGSAFNQQGGMYGNSNNSMGNSANMFGGSYMGIDASQGMNFGQSSSMMGLGMARGRMNGYNMGYGGMNTQTVPYF